MTTARNFSRYLKQGLIFLGLLAIVAITLPVVATLAFAFRMVLLAALVGLVVAFAASPRLRRYVVREAEASLSYGGLRMPSEELLHPTHSWARPEGAKDVVVGVDDLAQRVLGPIDAVDLPDVGKSVRQGEVLWRMRHDGRELEVKAPVDGVVARINGLLTAQPTLINDAPYGAGWVVAMKPTRLGADRKLLRHGNAARVWFRGEVDRLKQAIAPQLVPSAVMQDGGQLVEELHRQLDDTAWERIKESFFA